MKAYRIIVVGSTFANEKSYICVASSFADAETKYLSSHDEEIASITLMSEEVV